MTPKQQIRAHAEQFLSHLGTVFVKNVRKKPGWHQATVMLATIDTVEHFRAYVGDGAIGMIKERTEKIPMLPLFA